MKETFTVGGVKYLRKAKWLKENIMVTVTDCYGPANQLCKIKGWFGNNTVVGTDELQLTEYIPKKQK